MDKSDEARIRELAAEEAIETLREALPELRKLIYKEARDLLKVYTDKNRGRTITGALPPEEPPKHPDADHWSNQEPDGYILLPGDLGEDTQAFPGRFIALHGLVLGVRKGYDLSNTNPRLLNLLWEFVITNPQYGDITEEQLEAAGVPRP